MFKRAAEWGDGWVVPIDSPMDRIRDGCAQLRRLAEGNGRDPNSLKVTVCGHSGQFRDPHIRDELEGAGVARITFWLMQTQGAEALAEMEETAREVL